MQIERFILKKKIVSFRVAASNQGDLDGEAGLAHGKRGTIEAEADALPSLHKAFSNLRRFVSEILEITDEGYHEKIQVYGLEVTRTSEGTKTAKLLYSLQLESRVDFLHRSKTPAMQVDKAAAGESGDRQVSSKAALAIVKAIDEAEGYAMGKRSQQRLDLKSDALAAQVEEGKEDGPSLF